MNSPVRPDATLLERLENTGWVEVVRQPALGACWEWQGGRTPKGYGQCSVGGGRTRGAHRVAFEVWNEEIAAGNVVCHRCDNPPCINPAHLFQGSHSDNFRDMQAKGRDRYARGEKHGIAKLTDTDVDEIRALASSGSKYGDLASRFSVSSSNIGRIVRGQSRTRTAA